MLMYIKSPLNIAEMITFREEILAVLEKVSCQLLLVAFSLKVYEESLKACLKGTIVDRETDE